MKAPESIVLETAQEAEDRRIRNGVWEARNRARARYEAPDDEKTPFQTVTHLLSFFFGLKDHVASVAAMDPSRERIDGARPDRDTRKWKVGIGWEAMAELERAQGNSTGKLLLWLHLRPRLLQEGRVTKGGKRKPSRFLEPVPLWELWREPYVHMSQRAARNAYFEALRLLEEWAWKRGYIEFRSGDR